MEQTIVILPEVKLKKVIDYILSQVDSNYLSLLFGDEKLGNYDFLENALAIFVNKTKDNPRKIESHLFFARDRATLPTIHINSPSDVSGGDNSNMFDFEEKFKTNVSLQYRKITPRTYQSKFNIIFTSDNTFEVGIMYAVFKSILQGNIFLLEHNGFRNVKLSGNDIIFNEGMMPLGIYAKALMIDCVYTFKAISLTEETAVTDIITRTS